MSTNKKAVIRVKKVSKSFRIPHEKNKTLKSAIFNIFKRTGYSIHEAARDISFEVIEGEFLGIIGRNGSGKSTMLKMLAGIYLPDEGTIEIEGRLSPFLELGVGFNPELSARDNVYLNGTILGLTRKEIDEKFEEIIGFAELEEFVDQKLKNFSSGMQVRLAFSVAIQAHADILLIDEVLAVGDVSFQQKCFEKFRQFKKEGKTIVFVSHAMDNIREFCDRVVLIEGAVKAHDGSVKEGVDKYYEYIFTEKGNKSAIHKKLIHKDDVAIKTLVDGKEVKTIQTGNTLELQILPKVNTKIPFINLGVALYREDGLYLFGTRTETPFKNLGGDMSVSLNFNDFPINYPGSFYFEVKVYDDDINRPLAWIKQGELFFVDNPSTTQKGLFKMKVNWGSE